MVGGARLSGEKNWLAGMCRKSVVNPSPQEVAGARTVGVSGVIGVIPLEGVVPKNWVPNIPGEIGIPCAGNTNLVMSLSELCWFICCCWACCCCCCAACNTEEGGGINGKVASANNLAHCNVS